MSRQWYGDIFNRLEEDRMFTKTIEVGTGVTEYLWSDRRPYEVIAVKDQKHVTVRALDHKHIGTEWYDNEWELISNPDNCARDLTKRGDYWYWTATCTKEELDSADAEGRLRIALAGFDADKIAKTGKQTKYHRAHVSFGVAEYYYDPSF